MSIRILREGDDLPRGLHLGGDCPATTTRNVAGYGPFTYACMGRPRHLGDHYAAADTDSGREYVAAVWTDDEAAADFRREAERATRDQVDYERDRRRFLGLDEPPLHATPPPTTPSGGSGMSVNVESARAGVMRAHQDGQTGLAELAAAHSSLEDAANGLRNSTWGSNQPEADQAHGQLAEALQKIDEARSQVASALAEFEGVAQRL